MTVLAYFLAAIAALELLLAIVLMYRYRRSEIVTTFVLFILSVVLWVGSIALFFLVDSTIAIAMARLYYVAAAGIALFYVFFAVVFPFRSIRLTGLRVVLVTLPFVVVSLITTLTDWLVKSFVVVGNTREIIWGSFYHEYAVYFLIYWIIGTWFLAQKFRRSDGVHFWQLKYLLYGITVSSIMGIGFDLLLPWFGNYTLIWIGPLSSIVWLGFTTYIIFRRT